MRFLRTLMSVLLISSLQIANNCPKAFADEKPQAGPYFRIFRQIMERLSFEEGQKYLDVTLTHYPELLIYFDQFRENDHIGEPIIYDYGDKIGYFSPSTLQYIKILGDLKHLFGDLSKMRIVEIGGGYGGLCKTLSVLGFAQYTIIDTPQNLLLSKNYLSQLGVKGVTFVESENINPSQHYDLVIVHSTWSKIKKSQQEKYLRNIVVPTANGYVWHHAKAKFFGINSFSIADIVSLLHKNHRKGKVEPERFLIGTPNQLITWKPNGLVYKNTLANNRLFLKPSVDSQKTSAITYGFSGGRLGDNLLAYLHAKWIAYKYQMPFLYKPFDHSDKFQFSQMDQKYEASQFSFCHMLSIAREQEINQLAQSTLFEIPYFPNSQFEYETVNLFHLPFFQPNWDDPNFRSEVVECLKPIDSINTLELPQDCMTVALHIRRGGGVDSQDERNRVPLKFPPDSYYIKQLKLIAHIFKNIPLYVHIFTDDPNPQKLIDKYKKFFDSSRISFACRTGDNGPHINILEDFYSLTKFDCIIRSESNFSVVASKLGNYQIEIGPAHYRRISNQKIVIDQIELTFGRFKEEEQ